MTTATVWLSTADASSVPFLVFEQLYADAQGTVWSFGAMLWMVATESWLGCKLISVVWQHNG